MEVTENNFLECDRRYKSAWRSKPVRTNGSKIAHTVFDPMETMHAEYTRKIEALEARLDNQEKIIANQEKIISRLDRIMEKGLEQIRSCHEPNIKMKGYNQIMY